MVLITLAIVGKAFMIVVSLMGLSNQATTVALVQSDTNTIVTIPSPSVNAMLTNFTYPRSLTAVPTAKWIWMGHGNESTCPMNIRVEAVFSQKCLGLPLTFWGGADNSYNGTISLDATGVTLVNVTSGSSNWSSFTKFTLATTGIACSEKLKLTIDAVNNQLFNYTNCYMNPAGVIFGVISNDCPCASGRYYDSASCGCVICPAGCLVCPNASVCTTCNTAAGYTIDLVTKSCVCNGIGSCAGPAEVCGNSIVETSEGCDDGNLLIGDGCDSSCLVQLYYQCAVNSGNTASTCWLVGPLQLTQLDTNFSSNHNSANITFSVWPDPVELSTKNWSTLISVGAGFTIGQFYYSNGVLSAVVTSNQSLDGQTITLSGTSQPLQVSQLSVVFPTVVVDNGQIQPSQPAINGLDEALGNVLLVTVVLYWLTFLAALHRSKIIGAQMMGVLQISFIGLSCLNSRSTVSTGAPYLRYSDGWNPLFKDIGVSGASPRLSYMGFRSVFLSDYNLMVLILLLPPMFGLILYIIEKVRLSKEKQSALGIPIPKNPSSINKFKTDLLTDYILAIALVSTYGVVFAWIINLRNDAGMEIASTVLGGVIVAALLGVMIYYAIKKHNFRECLETFKSLRLPLLQPIVMFIDRVGFSLIAAFLGQQEYCPYVLIGWVVIYSAYLAIIKPYTQRYNYFRGLATQSASIGITMLYCILEEMSDTAYILASRVVPIVVVVILLLNLIGNLVFIVLDIKKKHAAKNEKQSDQPEDLVKQKEQVQVVEMDFLRTMRERLENTQRGAIPFNLNETMWKRKESDE